MFFFFSEFPERARVEIRLGAGLPIWSLLHFMSAFEECYIKLITMAAIIGQIESGASDDQFAIATFSADLYPNQESSRQSEDQSKVILNRERLVTLRDGIQSSPRLIPDPQIESVPRELIPTEGNAELRILGGKSGNPSEFWRLLGVLKRPIVIFNDGGSARSLYQFDGIESLKLTHAKLMSPSDLGFEGLLSGLASLIQVPGQIRRDQENHEKEMEMKERQILIQDIQLIRDFASVSKIVESTPENSGYGIYARRMLCQTQDRMMRLMEKANASAQLRRIDV